MAGHYEFLKHTGLCPVSFHMPGHKGNYYTGYLGYGQFLDHIMDCDITEIPGADNLFQTEGIIQETQEKYRELYDVRKSYLLINGTSGGLIAAVLAAVEPGDELILARNCHKSVFNALSLGNIKPVYAYPQEEERYGIAGVVTAEEIEKIMEAHPQAKAVVLPSPNYYGICSDIAAIAEVVHKYDGVLIVDQAHGAHLKFEDLRCRHHRGQHPQDTGVLHTERCAPRQFGPDQPADPGGQTAENREHQSVLSSHGFSGSQRRDHPGARDAAV